MEREKQAWAFIHARYPLAVNKLLRDVVEEISPLICDSSIVLVGSFSDGRARYILNGNSVRYLSDIDLVVVTRGSVETLITRRSAISLCVDRLASSLVTSGPTFHIGIRYRSESELPTFAHKVTTLGYLFWQRALWLRETFPVDFGLKHGTFGIGHCAENICSKLWVVLRYLAPHRMTNEAESFPWVIRRAVECMWASMKYHRWLGTRSINSQVEDSQASCFNKSVAKDLVMTGRIATQIAQNFKDQCLEASHDEEFDFFRAAQADCALLPQLLLTLLDLGWRLDDGRPAGDVGRRAYRLARCLDLSIEPEQCLDELHTYYRVRYLLAAQRIALSPLFARDRGPEFLNSLGQEP